MGGYTFFCCLWVCRLYVCMCWDVCGLCVVYVYEDVCVICYVCGICVHVCMDICVDMYVCRHTYTCVHVCGARGVLGVFLNCCLSFIYSLIGWLLLSVPRFMCILFFCVRKYLSLNLSSTGSIRLTGQQALGSLLSLHPQSYRHRHAQLCLTLCYFDDPNLGLHAFRASTLHTEPSIEPVPLRSLHILLCVY